MRPHSRIVATLTTVSLTCTLIYGCGIGLTDELSGKPCKDGECLPGWECNAAQICVREDQLSGGRGGTRDSGAGESGATATGGAGGAGGAEGPDASLAGAPSQDAAADAEADTGADAPDTGGSDRAGLVGCRDFTCGLDTGHCCVASVPGYPGLPSGFSCESETSGCAWVLRCDGDHDCPAGQQCCAPQAFGTTTVQCQSACDAPEAHVECTKSDDCGEGLLCCGRIERAPLIQTPLRYDRIRCQASCSGTDDRVVCDTDDDCIPGSGTSCSESAIFPGLFICQ
jgi:hypothetical protein